MLMSPETGALTSTTVYFLPLCTSILPASQWTVIFSFCCSPVRRILALSIMQSGNDTVSSAFVPSIFPIWLPRYPHSSNRYLSIYPHRLSGSVISYSLPPVPSAAPYTLYPSCSFSPTARTSILISFSFAAATARSNALTDSSVPSSVSIMISPSDIRIRLFSAWLPCNNSAAASSPAPALPYCLYWSPPSAFSTSA